MSMNEHNLLTHTHSFKTVFKVAPLGVVAGEEYGFVSKHVGIEVEICHHFGFDVVKLRIELVVLSCFRFFKVCICHACSLLSPQR